jgi:nicotinate phosphoribosyltransferase
MSVLRTDLYQLTMVAGYFHQGRHDDRVTFELFVRGMPAHRRYLLFAGLDRVVDHLSQLCFDDDARAFLETVPALRPALTPEFMRYLTGFRFTGDVWAMPEGTVFFPGEPVMRVSAPLPEAQLVETFALSVVNSETLVASKAARIVVAAGDDPVLEFGTRRTAPDAAVRAARAAYLAGFAATSNVEAGRRYALPLRGTSAHAWTLAFGSEREAFAAQTSVYGGDTIMLLDTYDTMKGLEHAIEAAPGRLDGVRLDSGDLLDLSRKVRVRLDAAGLSATQIVASGDLDETEIARLRAAGAPIDAWGVGTRLVRSVDAPDLGGVYKLVFDDARGRPRMKSSPGKGTRPGVHQVYRRHADGVATGDVVALASEDGQRGEALLRPVMRRGERVGPEPSLDESRARARAQIDALPADSRRLDGGGDRYPVEVSTMLQSLTQSMPAGGFG